MKRKMVKTTELSDQITAYFFTELNVDDLYCEEEFRNFSQDIAFMIQEYKENGKP